MQRALNGPQSSRLDITSHSPSFLWTCCVRSRLHHTLCNNIAWLVSPDVKFMCVNNVFDEPYKLSLHVWKPVTTVCVSSIRSTVTYGNRSLSINPYLCLLVIVRQLTITSFRDCPSLHPYIIRSVSVTLSPHSLTVVRHVTVDVFAVAFAGCMDQRYCSKCHGPIYP